MVASIDVEFIKVFLDKIDLNKRRDEKTKNAVVLIILDTVGFFSVSEQCSKRSFNEAKSKYHRSHLRHLRKVENAKKLMTQSQDKRSDDKILTKTRNTHTETRNVQELKWSYTIAPC